MQVKIKKLHEDAIVPTYGTFGAACFDLYALYDGNVGLFADEKSVVFGTGLAFEIPKDHVMLVFSRSGHGFNHNVRLANCTGVIDSDYRGEVKVKLTADEETPFVIDKHERIAQAMIIPVQQVQFELSNELSDTARGTGGFGSTGQ